MTPYIAILRFFPKSVFLCIDKKQLDEKIKNRTIEYIKNEDEILKQLLEMNKIKNQRTFIKNKERNFQGKKHIFHAMNDRVLIINSAKNY